MQGCIAGGFSVCLDSRACLLSAVSLFHCFTSILSPAWQRFPHRAPRCHSATFCHGRVPDVVQTLSSPAQLPQCQPCMWCIFVSTDSMLRCGWRAWPHSYDPSSFFLRSSYLLLCGLQVIYNVFSFPFISALRFSPDSYAFGCPPLSSAWCYPTLQEKLPKKPHPCRKDKEKWTISFFIFFSALDFMR